MTRHAGVDDLSQLRFNCIPFSAFGHFCFHLKWSISLNALIETSLLLPNSPMK
jgi:hypothetical protein